MAGLTKADTAGVLRFVAEADGAGGDAPFTGDLLVELGRLVEADWVTYCELDRVRRRVLLNVQRSGDTSEPDDDDLLWSMVVDEHPVCVRHQQGYVGALKVSDFFSRREFHATRLYDLWFRPLDIEHELDVAIPSPLWHTKTFLFDRQGRRDFTERDRLVLEALLPHLTRLWQAARTRRLLAAALAELDTGSPADSRGVILLGAGGRVEFATPAARRLVGEFFPDRLGARLPDALDSWLEAGAAEALVRCRDGRRLTIQHVDDTLLLEARQAEMPLTPREREVLAWVARGKTNAEIARLLWLSPSTVGKHLENVYGKLGVSTRTAAVAHFLGLIDAEASQLG